MREGEGGTPLAGLRGRHAPQEEHSNDVHTPQDGCTARSYRATRLGDGGEGQTTTSLPPSRERGRQEQPGSKHQKAGCRTGQTMCPVKGGNRRHSRIHRRWSTTTRQPQQGGSKTQREGRRRNGALRAAALDQHTPPSAAARTAWGGQPRPTDPGGQPRLAVAHRYDPDTDPWREDAEARDPSSSSSNQPAVQQGDSSQQEAATLPRPSSEPAGTGADSAQPATASQPQREQTVPDNNPPQEQATVGDDSAAEPTEETAVGHHTPPGATDEQPPQPHEELTDTCAAAACGRREGEEAAKAEATGARDAAASSKHEGQGDQRRGNKWRKAVIKAEQTGALQASGDDMEPGSTHSGYAGLPRRGGERGQPGRGT